MRELNEAQQRAVRHVEGPMMVLAGPGSGKTTVITERVRFLVQEQEVPAENILVITFTKAAATEMKERYLAENPGSTGVWFGTFHSIFFMMLRLAYHYTADNILKEEMRYQILREIVSHTELEIQDEREFMGDLSEEISKIKGEGINLEHYYSPICPENIFRDIFRKYQETLQKRRLIDFDDMLVYCYELLAARKDILASWQKRFPYILIDEFQDINQVQYQVIKLLAGEKKNLFIVGDDDQSIYGFRGANPDIMQKFLKDYRDAKECVLGINYRCDREIVEAAGRLIAVNKNRLPKDIQGVNSQKEAIGIRGYKSSREQNENLVAEIIKRHQKGVPFGEIAVLFRTNPQARGLTSKLMEHNIPFYLKERLPNIYEHWIAQDLITYVEVALGNRDRGKVWRVINRPSRYVHKGAVTERYIDFEELKLFYEEKPWMIDRIEQLQADLRMVASLRPYAAINFIRKGIGYEDYISEYAKYRGIRREEMLDILDELQEDARGIDSLQDWFDHIKKYGEELMEQAKTAEKTSDKEAVNIMTMHGSKGLEFSCVFIPDANEGMTPHGKAVLQEDMEEERRMFYVAMTRAKHKLYISFVKERLHREVDPSRFLTEIAKDKEKWQKDLQDFDKTI